MLKSTVKIVAVIYLAAFLMASAYFPRTTLELLRDAQPRVLMMPASLSFVARAYWQFVEHEVWPFDGEPAAQSIVDLVQVRGKEVWPGVRRVTLDMTPSLRPGQEGRLSHTIGPESLAISRTGAFAEVLAQGALVQVGGYFCFSEPLDHPALWLNVDVRCARLSRKGKAYEWRELGQRARVAIVDEGR